MQDNGNRTAKPIDGFKVLKPATCGRKKIMAKLVIFRHGQTEFNAKKLMTGQADVPLTDLGKEQAHKAGKAMKHISFDKVYSSNLSRAHETASRALDHTEKNDHLKKECGNWDIEQRVEIIERDTGDFTGRKHQEDPEILAHPRDYETPLPNGESIKETVERVEEFFINDVIPRLEAGENVLIVCHAGIVRAFDIILGDAEKEFGSKVSILNATPVVHSYEDGKRIKRITLDVETGVSNDNKPVPKTICKPKPPKFN